MYISRGHARGIVFFLARALHGDRYGGGRSTTLSSCSSRGLPEYTAARAIRPMSMISATPLPR